MKTLISLLSVLFVPALSHALSRPDVIEFRCQTNNGITIVGRDSGERKYDSIVMNVETNWFGFKKSFKATSYFSENPKTELTIHMEAFTADGRPDYGDNSSFFLRGPAKPDSNEAQSTILSLLKPGYMYVHSPGEKILVSMANCQLVLRQPQATATAAASRCESLASGK
jgi:hypothetical protein